MYLTPDRKFPRIVIDVETTSELDLKKVGAYKYAQHPSTQVLCLSWALQSGLSIGEREIHRWVPGDELPVWCDVPDLDLEAPWT
jgi:DNA polymerase